MDKDIFNFDIEKSIQETEELRKKDDFVVAFEKEIRLMLPTMQIIKYCSFLSERLKIFKEKITNKEKYSFKSYFEYEMINSDFLEITVNLLSENAIDDFILDIPDNIESLLDFNISCLDKILDLLENGKSIDDKELEKIYLTLLIIEPDMNNIIKPRLYCTLT